MNFRELLEKKDITKEAKRLLVMNDEVMLINSKGIMVNFTDYEDGVFYGLDQHDNEVEEKSLKNYELG